MSGTMMVIEQARLRECEKTIEKGLATFIEVGEALAEIRDKRLYRDSHKTFQAYCKDRWGHNKEWANRLISAADTVQTTVQTSVQNESQRIQKVAPPAEVNEADLVFPKVSNERQARELGKVPAAKRSEVLEESATNGEVTAASIRKAAATLTDEVGDEIPKKLQAIFAGRVDLEEKAREIQKLVAWAESLDEDLTAFLNVQALRADLNNAKKALRHAKPYAVCPYCRAKKATCTGCKGTGWVTKSLYDAAPTELRK